MLLNNRLWRAEEMVKFYAEKFVALAATFRSITNYLKGASKDDMSKEMRGALAGELATTLELLKQIGLRQSAKKAQKISSQTTYAGYDGPHLARGIDELQERIKDELEDGYFLHLSPEEAKLFESTDPLFGGDVQGKFPGATYEIDEAAKCLALGRSTACVFHLMRVMEIGIGSVRQSIGIPDPIKGADRNWGAILRKIKDAIDRKSTPWKPGDKALFEEAYASLDAVRAAWRNATMHVESKYNPDEAEHIYAVVKGFMRKIASRMDESGQPPA